MLHEAEQHAKVMRTNACRQRCLEVYDIRILIWVAVSAESVTKSDARRLTCPLYVHLDAFNKESKSDL